MDLSPGRSMPPEMDFAGRTVSFFTQKFYHDGRRKFVARQRQAMGRFEISSSENLAKYRVRYIVPLRRKSTQAEACTTQEQSKRKSTGLKTGHYNCAQMQ